MNGCPLKFSPLTLALMTVVAAGPAAADVAAPTANSIAEAERNAPYPTFAQAPATPKDVRTAQAWKVAVVALRVTGARMARLAANQPWTLSDTAGWAAREREEAAPPPPITTPSEGDTEAFVKAMRARATPPPRSH